MAVPQNIVLSTVMLYEHVRKLWSKTLAAASDASKACKPQSLHQLVNNGTPDWDGMQ